MEGPLRSAPGGGACSAEGVPEAAPGGDPGVQPSILRDQEEGAVPVAYGSGETFQRGDRMLDLLEAGLQRVVRFLAGEVPAGEVESPASGIPDWDLSTSLNESPVDLSRWTVTEHTESPFEKVVRLYVQVDYLVIRSDLDNRGFRVPLVDVDAVLDGELRAVRLLGGDEEVGVVRLSVSGRGVNFLIEPVLYTSPLTRVVDVLEGRARKAAVFVGRVG